MSEVYLVDQDYQATISVCEAGLELVNRHRKHTGSDLTLYVILQPKDLADDSLSVRKSFNVALSTSLVHLYPPKHHTRAVRILDDILTQDPNHVECLMGRGFIFQYARKWHEAASCFTRVCGILTEESRERIRAHEEQAWCEVQLNHFDQAITGLREVIELLDNEEDNDEDKSRAYWRLGKAYWEMGSK